MDNIVAHQFERLEQLQKEKSPKDRITQTYIETKLECLEQSFTSFKEDHADIVSAVDPMQKNKIPYFESDTYGNFEENYIIYKSLLKDALRKFVKDKEPTLMASPKSSCEIKLPRIQLPIFTGKHQEWQAFYDMFVSLIHGNQTLSPVQKLHYLKGSLSGEPENLLRNLSTTELNYAEAWKQLTRRYNNKRYNCNAIMKNLFAQKQILFESASDIRQLLDTTLSALKSLANIGIDTKSWDAIIIHMTVSKLDPESHRQWEGKISESSTDDLPKWSQLIEFLESRFRTLEMIDTTKTAIKQSQTYTKPAVKPRAFHTGVQDEKPREYSVICTLCSGQHYLFQCKEFGKKTPHERQDFVQTARLCYNCLAPSHPVKLCHQSTSCRKCGKKHHTLLHFEKREVKEATSYLVAETNTEQSKVENQYIPQNVTPERVIISNHSGERVRPCTVLLATAKVIATSTNGNQRILRALIDQGSQASFVTEETVQLLGLKKVRVNGSVSGIGDGHLSIKYMVEINIKSMREPNHQMRVQAYVLNQLTSLLPTENVNKLDWLQIEQLSLADPAFSLPGKIDALLGADIYCNILLEGVKKSPQGNLVAQNTSLGWILSGKTSTESPSVERIINMHVQIKEDEQLKKFWELEAEPNGIERKLSKQEKRCEELFESTTTRDEEGRLVVSLPFKTDDPDCQYGKLREISQSRYNFLERKLSKSPKLSSDYHKVLNEYVELNHMKMIEEDDEKNDPRAVYLPHHAVVREERETTKVRVVFDASCKGVNNVSLNDNLLVGPKLQDDLRHILMRWRCHKICLVGDITKMYRQVRVKEEDTRFQRILWKPDPNGPLQHYKMLRLTFGTACAPYLAVKSLQRLSDDECAKYPIAAKITKRDFYVDDLLTGGESESEGLQIFNEMNELMKAGGFQISKWSSNNNELLDAVSEDKLNDDQTRPIKIDKLVKVLGVNWRRNTDNFEYSVYLPELIEPVTKRKVLSDISRLYDPLGWISPIVVNAKMFMQRLWKANLMWDENLPDELRNEWLIYRENLQKIQNICIPRWMNTTGKCDVELHAFADASKAAYAAVLYLRSTDQFGNVHVSLVTAKTKVSPIEREISIPRLELCGALLAARLLYEASIVLSIPKKKLHAWTDSTVVLAWLKGLTCRWTTFISNRVSEIKSIVDFDQWSHVATNSNPADCASRGMAPAELINHQLWWRGPEWLLDPNVDFPQPECTTTEELKPVKSLAVAEKSENTFLWSKYSSLSFMLKVLSYCRRVINRKKSKSERPCLPKYVTSGEMHNTLLMCIKQLQEFEFGEDLKNMKSREYVPKNSVLHTLCPFVDNGIIRDGGRIHFADLSYDKKHPIVLPAKSLLTSLMIKDAHERTLHGGPQVMLNYLRGKFWIIKARERVKKHYRECVICIRYAKSKSNQLMGQIPECRLTPTRAFKSSGVDYAGPIQLRFSPGRGAKSYKGYICLFVCMVTHAIHLEVVSDLSANGFIAAFRRFTSRRGHCQNLYSDNGSNFVGADKQLREMFSKASANLHKEIGQLLTLEKTTWHFIPPHAPNFGGLWEAGVRSMKTHLRKVIGDSTLTYEELSTVLTQIEACLNSRPLSRMSDCPNDPMPLTPGHFLVGEPLITVADEDCTDQRITGLERWKLTQRMVENFWKRWSKEYLVNLSQRYKWTTKKSEPNINDVVIVQEDNLPPSKWLLGKIVAKHPGKDNITRVVTIKCKNNTLMKRPTSKIILLPV